MTNPLNHFSDAGNRVLAIEIKVHCFCMAFDSQDANATKHGKSLSLAKGDQVCDARPKYSTSVLYLSYATAHLRPFPFERPVGHLSEPGRFSANALFI